MRPRCSLSIRIPTSPFSLGYSGIVALTQDPRLSPEASKFGGLAF